MSAAHTAGPWSVSDETDIYGTENDPANGCIGRVDVAHVYLRTVPGRTEANAALIAAAPDLLAALQSLHDRARLYGGTKGGKMDLEQARAAIAKATGAAS